MKLNLACGKDIKQGYVNMDWVKLDGVDVIHNIDKFPWPFKDNSFDEIYCSHILEHVDDLIKVMKEIKRIGKNNAEIIIRVPHFSCGVSYRDPTHKRLFSYFTFDYFTEGYFYKDMPKFKIQEKKLNFTRANFTFLNVFLNPIINLSPIIYERLFCWMLPCAEVLFKLKIEK
jgi:SAM-dependent methyltransferase